MDSKQLLQELFLDGLDACSPDRAVREAVLLDDDILTVSDHQVDLSKRPVYLFAVGKASLPMYDAVADMLGNRVQLGLAITDNHEQAEFCSADTVITGAHPEPDEKSVQAGKQAVQFFERVPSDGILINLISGGTSSLMCLPPEAISTSELSQLYGLLNNSGANIWEINTVRKHCSQIKGGQLLQYLNPQATVIDLVISDVPDDDLSLIGSGPTIPDLTTYQDAYHILLEYELWDQLSQSIRNHIELGLDGEVVDTLKPKDNPLDVHLSKIISSARKLALTVGQLAEQHGIKSWIADEAYNADVSAVAGMVKKCITESDSYLLVFYGESTVDVRGSGKGGRNQELALRGAIEIAGNPNTTLLCAGTDGIDGPTDAAGAIVDSTTTAKARRLGIDPTEYLERNDSYHFHEQLGTLFKTGSTGNNLMDVVLVFLK
jgi:glycerate-2-kinase